MTPRPDPRATEPDGFPVVNSDDKEATQEMAVTDVRHHDTAEQERIRETPFTNKSGKREWQL